MRLALDAPERVHALALLEPALLAVPTGPFGAEAIGRYQAGDKAGAIDAWMRGVCGPDYRAVLDRAIPGAVEQAVADADTFFAQELPAVRDWPITEQEAAGSPSRSWPSWGSAAARSPPCSASATSCCWPGWPRAWPGPGPPPGRQAVTWAQWSPSCWISERKRRPSVGLQTNQVAPRRSASSRSS
jgi:hypothetical protein